MFADFFESLYCGEGAQFYASQNAARYVKPATADDVRRQLQKMKTGKAADDNGIVAELLREGSNLLIEVITELFSAVLIPGVVVPEYWKASSIRVLLKKGDHRLPENYRPICIIPILYKVFSKVLCGRIKEQLIAQQSHDQAGFRPGFSLTITFVQLHY